MASPRPASGRAGLYAAPGAAIMDRMRTATGRRERLRIGLASALARALAGGMSRSIRAQDAGVEPAAPDIPQVQVLEAEILQVLDERQVDMGGRQQLVQTLELRFTSGDEVGTSRVIENGQWAAVNVPRYRAGDRVVVERAPDASGGAVYYVTDHVRRGALLGLFLLFVLISVGIGRAHGAASLVGMGLSFLVLFAFVLPQINAGRDPILIAILAAALIIPVTFYLSHGLNWKTSAAVGGTLITLLMTGLLARLAVSAAHLSGFASEEAYFVQAAAPGQVNLRGLLLASIIIGLLGILDDITVSQAAVVQQLQRLSPELPLREIYGRAMAVGRDHIASLVNTLVLVYASSAMPLLLLFAGDQTRFLQAVNYEVVAEELVRTLVASIGLIAAVPITTALACWMAGWGALDPGSETEAELDGHHGHAH